MGMPLTKKEQYKIYAILMATFGLGAFAVVFVYRQRIDAITIGVSVLLFGALTGVYMVISRLHSIYILRKTAIGLKKNKELTRITDSLSTEDAKNKAMRLLANSNKYQCIQRPAAAFDHKDDLAAELQSVFSVYEYISVRNGGWFFDRRRLSVSSHVPSHIVVGFSVGDCELAVPSKSETLLEVDVCETPAKIIGSYPSIYHWIIVDACLLYGIETIGE
jgi:hypothetical protein